MSFTGGSYSWPAAASAEFVPATSPQWQMSADAYDAYGSPSFHSPVLRPVPTHEKACARCKKLKIKCEMRSIEDVVYESCRRCVNGGHICCVPEKIERKIPVKRSELLQKIQEQTARIRELEAALARCTCGQAGAAAMSDHVRTYTRANIKSWPAHSSLSLSPVMSSIGSSPSEPPSPYSLPSSMQTGSYFREEDLQASMAQQLSRTGFEVPQFPADLSCGLVAPNPCMDFAAPNMHYDIQVVSEDGQVQPGAGYTTSSLLGWNDVSYKTPVTH